MNENAVIEVKPQHDRLKDLANKTISMIRGSRTSNTLRGYESDWNDFQQWCQKYSFKPLPADPKVIGIYLTDISESVKVSTVKRRLAGIAHYHLAEGYESPRMNSYVKSVLAGISRSKGASQDAKRPILRDDLEAMLRKLPDSMQGIRDRALLLTGYYSAGRRAELVDLDVDDIEFEDRGMILTIKRSKTDPESLGRRVAIPYAPEPQLCPVNGLKRWLTASGIQSGPVFRAINKHGNVMSNRLTSQSVALVVKRTAENAGLDATQLSGHSLRSGFCTSAALAGVEERLIQRQTGHKNAEMVRHYIRESDLFRQNAASVINQ